MPYGKALYKGQVLLHHRLLESFRSSMMLAHTWLYMYQVTGKVYMWPDARHSELLHLQHIVQPMQGFLSEILRCKVIKDPRVNIKSQTKNMLPRCGCSDSECKLMASAARYPFRRLHPTPRFRTPDCFQDSSKETDCSRPCLSYILIPMAAVLSSI